MSEPRFFVQPVYMIFDRKKDEWVEWYESSAEAEAEANRRNSIPTRKDT